MRHTLTRALGSLGVLIAIWALVASTPAAAQGSRPPGCRRAFWGSAPPKLDSPQAAADHLRRKVNFRVWLIHRFFLSLFTTPFKSVGVVGWTSYCTQACGSGEVVHADGSLDGYYTVDLALDSFTVGGQPTELEGRRFIRAEIRGPARKEAKKHVRRKETAKLCGELRWDHDGFLEIHPRQALEDTWPSGQASPTAGTGSPPGEASLSGQH